MPRLAVGTMTFGTTVPRAVAHRILDTAVERGATFLDTANNYAFWAPGATGDESETVLGEWLSSRPGARDAVTLATKIGARPAPGSHGFDRILGLSAEAVRAQVDASVSRLGVECIDVLYAHIDDRAVPLAETVGALQAEVLRGTVRHIACSNITAPRLDQALTVAGDGARYTAAQQRFSYLRPQPGADFFPHVFVDDDLDALCAREGVALLGYAALLGGAYSRADKDLPDGYATPETPRMLAALAHASQVSGLDAGQTVLSWMAHRRSPVIPVVGVSSREQLLSAIHAVETRLDDDTMKHMSQARGDAG